MLRHPNGGTAKSSIMRSTYSDADDTEPIDYTAPYVTEREYDINKTSPVAARVF